MMRQNDRYEGYGQLNEALEALVLGVVKAHSGKDICLKAGTGVGGKRHETNIDEYNAYYDGKILSKLEEGLSLMLADAHTEGMAVGKQIVRDGMLGALGIRVMEDDEDGD